MARDYATKRKAFGKLIIDYSLHCQTLSNMEVECRASFLTLMFVAKLLGKSEMNQADREEKEMLRLITPLLKLYSAKQSISVASESIEAFGGQGNFLRIFLVYAIKILLNFFLFYKGYIEDTGIPNLLRDAQVF